ncbi:hypothetical protein BDW22DRAFT_1424401 [Trametopsis cervina]|nr:hypothetical protein BDW22DRAFT_1424401 [Trametopsis cervina]
MSFMLLRTLLTLTVTLSTTARSFVSANSLCTSTPLLFTEPDLCAIRTMTEPSPEWLQDHLAELLASPYIHFTQPKLPGRQLRMGPGPVDLFSTRFSNMFARDATGVVNGQEVGKDDLKQSLLKLQKHYTKDSLKCTPQGVTHGQVSTKMAWSRKDSGSNAEIAASAKTKDVDGTHKIADLKVDCDPELLA